MVLYSVSCLTFDSEAPFRIPLFFLRTSSSNSLLFLNALSLSSSSFNFSTSVNLLSSISDLVFGDDCGFYQSLLYLKLDIYLHTN